MELSLPSMPAENIAQVIAFWGADSEVSARSCGKDREVLRCELRPEVEIEGGWPVEATAADRQTFSV